MRLLIFILLFPLSLFSQSGTWPVRYSDADPTTAPTGAGTRIHINTSTNTLFFWEPAPSSTWRRQPKGFEQITGCSDPAYTPTALQSTFAINSCNESQGGPKLYQYVSGNWLCLNCVAETELTAGAGIQIDGTAPDITISNTGDLSTINELNTSLSVTDGNLRLTDPGGNLDVPVSSIAPVQAVAAGSGIIISGTTTRTVSAADDSPTNEIQTLSIAGGNLSISGGNTVTLPVTGITSLNGLTGGTQTFATGTSGTDFGISSSGTTHTFNLPDASASNRGALTSANWTTFNSKIGGNGTVGQIPYMSASATITTEGGSGANNLAWDASNNRLGVGTASPSATLHVQGSSVLFQNSGALSLTLNDASNGNIPAVYFQQGGTTRATIEAGVGLSAGLFFSSGVTRLMSFGYGTASSSKFGRTYSGNASGPVDGIAVEGLSGFGSLAPTSRAHINGANGYTQFRLEKTYTPTGTSDALGATGDIAWDDNYFYIKTSAGWKRAALSTF